MRLDKFLKVSRLIKRRTLAKEVSDAGRVEINGRPAKAASEVKPGGLAHHRFRRETGPGGGPGTGGECSRGPGEKPVSNPGLNPMPGRV